MAALGGSEDTQGTGVRSTSHRGHPGGDKQGFLCEVTQCSSRGAVFSTAVRQAPWLPSQTTTRLWLPRTDGVLPRVSRRWHLQARWRGPPASAHSWGQDPPTPPVWSHTLLLCCLPLPHKDSSLGRGPHSPSATSS